MKFKIFMSDYGFFNEARTATELGLRRTVNGYGWWGWVTREELEWLNENGYKYRILY